jgi:hypothetical protein
LHKLASVLAVAALAVVGLPGPADAATTLRRDPGTQLSPALNLQRARLTYGPNRTAYRLKLAELSRRRTQAIVRFYRPDYDLMIITKFVGGDRRVIARRTDYDTGRTSRFSRGVRVRWDFSADVITITNTRFLSGRSARLDAYTVPKGAMHGPLGEPDDYVTAAVRRG